MPAWALPEREAGQWVLRSGERPGAGARCPTAAFTSSNATGRSWNTTISTACRRPWPRTCGAACAAPPGPLVAGPSGPRRLAEGAKALRERTDRAIIGLFGGNLLEIGQFLYRNDNFLMLLAGNRGRAHEFLDRLVEIHLANLERFLAAGRAVHRRHRLRRRPGHAERAANVAGHVPRVLQAAARADVAAREGTGQREGHAPLLRRRPAAAADLIDAGLDAMNPVQITCAGHGRRPS